MEHQAVTSKRRVFLVAGGLLACVIAYSLVLVFHRGPSRQAVLDVMNIVVPLVVAAICGYVAAEAGTARMRWFWGLLALGVFFGSLGEATWAWYELVLHVEVPYPSWADVQWLAYYPLVFAGLMTVVFFRGDRRLPGLPAVLDGLLYAGLAAGIGWELMIRPTLDPTASFLVSVTNIAYPAGDLLLLVGLVSLAIGPARGKLPAECGGSSQPSSSRSWWTSFSHRW